MLIHPCIPCQHGDHEGHRRIVQAVPEGMMGGQECHCKGECRDRAKEVVGLDPLPDLDPGIKEFIEGVSEWDR